MPKTYPIQQSFSAGEISPLLLARTDQEGYRHSTEKLLNMVPTLHGPASSRPGFTHIETAISGELYCRMIPFHISFDESYAIIITTAWVYIADRDGFQIKDNLFINPDFSDGSTGWSVLDPGPAKVTFTGGTCRLESGATDDAVIRQTVTIPTGEEGDQFYIGLSGLTDDACRIMVGTALGLSDLADQVIVNEDGGVFFTPGINTVYVQYETSGGADRLLDTVVIANAQSAELFTKFPSPWPNVAMIEEVQFEATPGEGLMYLFQRDVEPQAVNYIGEHEWEMAPVIFTGTVPWGTDFPGSITFYRGRMYVGGTRADSVGIWASAPWDYSNFEIPAADPTDADPMYLPMSSDGDVVWLKGAKALFVGMDTGEHIIIGEGGANPTPSNVTTEQQSSYGSARVQPMKIGEQLAFTTTDRRKIYISAYSRDNLGWISEDVSYSSEHITKGLIREIEISNTPDQILWFPTLEGNLLGMTYDPRRKIIGWHRHETNGTIISTTVINTQGRAELWIAVVRLVGGVETLMFERSDPEFKLDSFKETTVSPSQTVFDGLDHLEGQTVQVLADGAVHPDAVVTGGTITLDYPAEHVAAGLQYDCLLKTLPIDMLTQDGSKASYMKSWIKLFVRVLDSSRPLINGVRPPIRNDETPMGEREPNRAEDIETAQLGWDLYGSIDIEQDLPLHITVLGIFGELAQDNI